MRLRKPRKRAIAIDPELFGENMASTPEYELIKQLIQARTEQNLTQKELAARSGTRQSNISRLENGRYNPTLELLKKIAGGLGKELHIELR